MFIVLYIVSVKNTLNRYIFLSNIDFIKQLINLNIRYLLFLSRCLFKFNIGIWYVFKWIENMRFFFY